MKHSVSQLAGAAVTVPASAYRPPLYPWVLSFLVDESGEKVSRIAVAVLHVVVGLLTCLLTASIATTIAQSLGIQSKMFPVVGALIVAVDPILLRHSSLIMTETIATFLTTATIWWWIHSLHDSRPRVALSTGLGLGLLLGIATLCRTASLAWAAIWIAALLYSIVMNTTDRKASASRVFGMLLGLAVSLGPWTLRNWQTFDFPIMTTTHGGYTLLLANNPVLYDHWDSSWSREWNENAFHVQWRERVAKTADRSETGLDYVANAWATETIRERPFMFVKGIFIRWAWLWIPWPSERQASLPVQCAIGAWYVGLYAFSLMGLMRLLKDARQSRSLWVLWTPALLLVASLMLVHGVYWSNMRMRAPLIPVLALLAGYYLMRTTRSANICFDAKLGK